VEKEAISKAFELARRCLKTRPQVTKEDIDAAIKKYFPQPKEVDLKYTHNFTTEIYSDFDKAAIKREIYALKKSRACGPSSIYNEYLMALASHDGFINTLKYLFD